MKSLKSLFMLIPIIGLTISSTAFAKPENCPAGDYASVYLNYAGYLDEEGYITFSPKNTNGDLKYGKEYWLSNYKMDTEWARAAYATALAAIATNGKVWIKCDGTSVKQIYLYSN